MICDHAIVFVSLPADQIQLTMHPSHRRFWREMLPRIKYRNPSVPISISRHNEATGPSLLHIYTRSLDSTSESGQEEKPSHSLEMRNLEESEILDALIAQTGALVIAPTPQELQEMQELKEFHEQSEKERVIVREHLLNERREAQLLKLAKGQGAA